MNKKDLIQQECLDAIGDQMYAGAVLGTGAGKTRLGLKHMMKNLRSFSKFLVVIPKNALIDEWINQAKDAGFNELIPRIDFTTYISLHKQSFDYDCVYFDECHNAKKKHGDWIRRYQGPVIGLTGTYPRYLNSESGMVCSEFFPKVYEYSIKEGISDNMLNDYKIYIHMLELDHRRTIITKKSSMSEQAHYKMHCNFVDNAKASQVMMKRIMRMKAMQSYSTKVKYAKRLLEQQVEKTLVFTDYTDQADIICEHTYHSKNKSSKENLDMFKNGEIDKLASVQQIAEGANIPNLKVGIILHAYANEKKLPQKIGRFLRLNPNDKATIHVLCYKDTIDVTWLKSALKSFDKSKIFKYDTKKTYSAVQ